MADFQNRKSQNFYKDYKVGSGFVFSIDVSSTKPYADTNNGIQLERKRENP